MLLIVHDHIKNPIFIFLIKHVTRSWIRQQRQTSDKATEILINIWIVLFCWGIWSIESERSSKYFYIPTLPDTNELLYCNLQFHCVKSVQQS